MGNKLSNHTAAGTEGRQLHRKERNRLQRQNQKDDLHPTFVCDSCLKSVLLENSFNIKGCAHFYCYKCVVKYIVSNLENNVQSIMCPVPGCTGVLDPEYCRPILPNDVFDWWGSALCHSLLDTENPVDSTFICDFCVEQIDLKYSFNIKGCTHFYCRDCIVKFVVGKLQDNVSSITCPVPGCSGVLDLEYCRPILPPDVFDQWGKALCESVVLRPKKYLYCPFNVCSALLIHDEADDTDRSQCPHCKREFCAKCKVAWHTEFDCDQFQKLRDKDEDKTLEQLALGKNWSRCPNCQYYVERNRGCNHVRCRCGKVFCYRCGSKATLFHACQPRKK